MQTILSNPVFVAAFNILDNAGPFAQLGVALVVVGFVSTGFGYLATVGYNKAIRSTDQLVLRMSYGH